MAYEGTEVTIIKSQTQIRSLIMGHKGNKIAFISEPPREGFMAVVNLDGVPYQIKISAELQPPKRTLNNSQLRNYEENELRRIWRVLYHHLKSIFEAADSGVMDFREMMLPYIVTKDGRTLAEHLLPKLKEAIEVDPARLLT
jgi:hypothetical protein